MRVWVCRGTALEGPWLLVRKIIAVVDAVAQYCCGNAVVRA
jgi:hypothetical protein